MATLTFHPAPGLGDLIPGSFVVPQNPVTAGIQRVATIGEILPGFYPVPQNPLAGANTKNFGRMPGDCGCGCAGAGTCRSSAGMGALSDYIPEIPESVAGIPVTYLLGGALLAYFILSRGSEYRDEHAELRAKYKYDAARLRRQSPRRYARVSQTLQEHLA
jgi:hypothetical protein